MIQAETDQAKRQAMIDEAFKIHKDEVGHIPLHQQPLSGVCRTRWTSCNGPTTPSICATWS